MRAKLRERKIPDDGIRQLLDLVRGHHYQLACKKYFALSHEGYEGESIGNHPNAYFDESEKFWRGKEIHSPSTASTSQPTQVQLSGTSAVTDIESIVMTDE